jgi:hypothetical protein
MGAKSGDICAAGYDNSKEELLKDTFEIIETI